MTESAHYTASHLLVDIDDTLIHATKIHVPIREAKDISYESMFLSLWKETYPDRNDMPEYTEDVCLFQLAAEHGLPLKELFRRMMKFHERLGIEVPDDAVEFLKKAKQTGFTVCTATTNSRMTALGKLAAGGMAEFEGSPYINQFFGGDVIDGGKSSPDFYRAILMKLQLPPERVVMIGDSLLADGQWAREAGIEQIVIINRYATEPLHISPEGFPVVNRLDHALSFIARA